jgi:hypothetical protein
VSAHATRRADHQPAAEQQQQDPRGDQHQYTP